MTATTTDPEVLDIPDDLLDKARLAAANCPESAITISED